MEIGQQARETTGQLAGQVGGQVKSQLATQKDQVAETAGSVAQALRMTGEQLRQQNQAPVSQFAESAAEMVERFSGYLREHEVEDMVGEVESFARRQPAVFLGTAFALGFVAARFLKSSGAPRYDDGRGYQGRSYHDYGSVDRAYDRGYAAPPYMGGSSRSAGAAPDYGRASDLTLSGEGSATRQSSTTDWGRAGGSVSPGPASTASPAAVEPGSADGQDTDASYAGAAGVRSSDDG